MMEISEAKKIIIANWPDASSFSKPLCEALVAVIKYAENYDQLMKLMEFDKTMKEMKAGPLS
jgi:hypothetical protein